MINDIVYECLIQECVQIVAHFRLILRTPLHKKEKEKKMRPILAWVQCINTLIICYIHIQDYVYVISLPSQGK